MTKVSKAPAGLLPASGGGQPSSTVQEDYAPRWTVIVPVVLIAAVVLLVGLPLGAVYIMNKLGCCLANSPENVVTFWASMTAGFLALFGMIITGVFVITAFRVDATARANAQIAAQEEVWTYVDRYEENLANDLRNLKTLVQKMTVEVEESGESAKQAFAKAQEDVEAQQKEASSLIAAALDETTNVANQAKEAVTQALEETTSAATEAQEAIGRAGQEVERQRDEAIRAIDSARQEAEAAAREVRERADRGIEGPAPTEGDDPEQRDE